MDIIKDQHERIKSLEKELEKLKDINTWLENKLATWRVKYPEQVIAVEWSEADAERDAHKGEENG